MRILHVIASYLPAVRYGGTIVSVHGLCRALAQRGHEVHVFTTSVDGDRDSAVEHDVPVDVDGVRVWYFRSQRLRRLYYAPRMAAAADTHIRSFDVVHSHAMFLWPGWAVTRRAWRAGVPYVVAPRGMLEKSLIEQKSTLAKSILIGMFERHVLERAAAIHVTSAREAEEARAFGFALPALCEIPNGVDGVGSAAVDGDVAHDIAALAAEPYALFLGRINWKKGLDRLVRALPHAPGVRVVLAGNDEEGYRRVLEPLATAYGVADRVVFTGPVAGANKQFLLAHARFLVLPSYSENFGNVVLEAMAVGRPALVTREVGAAGIVRDSGAGVVADGDPVTFGAALARLNGDAAGADAMGARGRLAVRETYSWDAVASRTETMYERIVKGCAPC